MSLVVILKRGFKYGGRVVSYIPLFGFGTTVRKATIDLSILMNLERLIPRELRCRWAHDFHWTFQLRKGAAPGYVDPFSKARYTPRRRLTG